MCKTFRRLPNFSSYMTSDEGLCSSNPTSSSGQVGEEVAEVQNIDFHIHSRKSLRLHAPIDSHDVFPNHCHSFEVVAAMYAPCDYTMLNNLPV